MGRENVRTSYQIVYDYLAANEGRFDITNPYGLFAECPEPVFRAYPYWSKIVRHAPPFGLEIDKVSWMSKAALQLWRKPFLGQLFWWLCRLIPLIDPVMSHLYRNQAAARRSE